MLSMPGADADPGGQERAIVGDRRHRRARIRSACSTRPATRVEADAKSPAPMPAGTTFAISIEPLGGSPTGAPTGPVVGSATLIRA